MSMPFVTKTTTTSYHLDNWQELKSKLKAKFPHLTDPDLDYEEGKVEAFIDNLSTKIGQTIEKTKEGLHKFISSL
jgi:uncharacterized protein YjbJ (UPF0337 family)